MMIDYACALNDMLQANETDPGKCLCVYQSETRLTLIQLVFLPTIHQVRSRTEFVSTALDFIRPTVSC